MTSFFIIPGFPLMLNGLPCPSGVLDSEATSDRRLRQAGYDEAPATSRRAT